MKLGICPYSELKRAPLIVTLAASLALLQGCASYQLRSPDSDPLMQTYEGEAPNAYAWGLIMSPQVMTAECDGEGINDVVIKRNYLQDLASVLTLGIWMPTVVEYRCRAPHGDGGMFPESDEDAADDS